MRAKTIGGKLTRALKRRKMTPADIAARAGNQLDHVEAVLDGYPNTRRRPTEHASRPTPTRDW